MYVCTACACSACRVEKSALELLELEITNSCELLFGGRKLNPWTVSAPSLYSCSSVVFSGILIVHEKLDHLGLLRANIVSGIARFTIRIYFSFLRQGFSLCSWADMKLIMHTRLPLNTKDLSVSAVQVLGSKVCASIPNPTASISLHFCPFEHTVSFLCVLGIQEASIKSISINNILLGFLKPNHYYFEFLALVRETIWK